MQLGRSILLSLCMYGLRLLTAWRFSFQACSATFQCQTLQATPLCRTLNGDESLNSTPTNLVESHHTLDGRTLRGATGSSCGEYARYQRVKLSRHPRAHVSELQNENC